MSWGLGGKKPPASVRTHEVLMSFHYEKGWRCCFFETDRRRTALPRHAFFNSDEDLFEFIQRAGGIKGSDERFYIQSAIGRQRGDVTLRLSQEQYQTLHAAKKARG
jgi:hypothetical protein